MATTDAFVNVNASTLAAARVVSLTSNQAEPWQKFVIADNRDFNLYFVDGAGAYIDVSAYTDIRVGVGGINKRPTSGSWTFTHGGNTAIVAYDESASNVEALLDAAPYSFDCAVTSPVAGVWIVKFNAVGAQTLPTLDASGLAPDSTASAKRLVVGDGSTKEEWIIRLFQVPWAYSESWAAISNGVTGSLNFGTENLYDAMGSSDSVTGFLEIELTDASANLTTVMQAPITILGPVIGDGATGSGAFELTIPKQTIIASVTGEDETLTTGAGKITWQMPYAMTVTAVRASVKTAPTGSTINVDINEGGSTILGTAITIDIGETSSATAATPPVVSDTDLADDAVMTIDVDQVGSGTAGVGLKVYITGKRA